MNMVWKETPRSEFPRSLEEETEYVKGKLSHIEYPAYDIALEIHNQTHTLDTPYDMYIHNACMLLYNNFHNESIITKIGVSLNKKYGIGGMRTAHAVVARVAGFMSTYRLVYTHFYDTIGICFDGIGDWKH